MHLSEVFWTESLTQLNINSASNIYFWLTKPPSLTAALRKVCRNLQVHINNQELATATQEEQSWLNIQEANSFIRDVYLVGDNIKMVHARVIAPNITYIYFIDELNNLGTNFIGEFFLFKRPHVRSKFQYAKFDACFARRSLFTLETKILMLTETILPTIPSYPLDT